jgi:hypothetical protein
LATPSLTASPAFLAPAVFPRSQWFAPSHQFTASTPFTASASWVGATAATEAIDQIVAGLLSSWSLGAGGAGLPILALFALLLFRKKKRPPEEEESGNEASLSVSVSGVDWHGDFVSEHELSDQNGPLSKEGECAAWTFWIESGRCERERTEPGKLQPGLHRGLTEHPHASRRRGLNVKSGPGAIGDQVY